MWMWTGSTTNTAVNPNHETHPTLLTALLLALLAASQAADFFVSPNGNDANPGTEAKPVATLERARDAARAARASDPKAGCRVVLGGGTYIMNRTLVFDLRDSAAGNAITEIVAAPNARPVLSGAAPLPGGWQLAPQDLPRLPKQARGRVWVAEVPKDWPVFRTLFQGDTMLPRARTRGFQQLKQSPAGGPAIDQRHLYLPAEAVQSVADFMGAEMVVVPVYPWVMNILPDDRSGPRHRLGAHRGARNVSAGAAQFRQFPGRDGVDRKRAGGSRRTGRVGLGCERPQTLPLAARWTGSPARTWLRRG